MRIVRATWGPRTFYAEIIEESALRVWNDAPWLSGKATSEIVSQKDVLLVAPVTPSKVLCVGRNYAAHAKELGNEVPKEPLLFLKPPSSIIGPDEPIVLP